MKRRLFLLLVLFLVSDLSTASAETLYLSWNSNTESDLSGYKVYYGTSSSSYTSINDLGNSNVAIIQNLNRGVQYHFAVTAYDSSGNESDFSEELVYTFQDVTPTPTPTPTPTATPIPSPTPTPTPVPSASPTPTPTPTLVPTTPTKNTDADLDGLTFAEELEIGTNPFLFDTDGDEIGDGQEVLDETDPLDRGSNISRLSNEFCGEWNSFFENQWNIFEVINQSVLPVLADVSIYRFNGQRIAFERRYFRSGQTDLLVHEFTQSNPDEYGKICVKYLGESLLSGRMTYYKVNFEQSRSDNLKVDYALAFPFANGKKGDQFVNFSNVAVSEQMSNNAYASWLQVTNVGTSIERGVVRSYNVDGVEVSSRVLELQASGRLDIAVHELGANLEGYIKWEPLNKEAKFIVRNVNYYYDNATFEHSFNSATQAEASYLSHQVRAVPVDTRSTIVKSIISNPTDRSAFVKINLYSEAGIKLYENTIGLSSNKSHIIDVNKIIGEGNLAMLKVTPLAESNILFSAKAFKLSQDSSLEYAYHLNSKQAIGKVHQGSYNTNFQEPEGWFVNPTDTAQTITISLERFDGTQVLSGRQIYVPANGLKRVNFLDYEVSNQYGTVTVQGMNKGLASWIYRRKAGDFLVPTVLQEG